MAPDSDDVQYVWETAELPNLLPNILVSTTLDKDLFLEVRKQRQRASQVLPHCSRAHGLCPHMGAISISNTATVSGAEEHLTPLPAFSQLPVRVVHAVCQRLPSSLNFL